MDVSDQASSCSAAASGCSVWAAFHLRLCFPGWVGVGVLWEGLAVGGAGGTDGAGVDGGNAGGIGGAGGGFPGDLGGVGVRVGRGGRGKGRENWWGLQGPRSVDSVTQA